MMILTKPLYPFSKILIFTQSNDDDGGNGNPIWDAVFRVATMYNLSGTFAFVNDWTKPIRLGGDYLHTLKEARMTTTAAPNWSSSCLDDVLKGGGKRNKTADLFLSFETDDALKKAEAQIEKSCLTNESRVFLVSREIGSKILPSLKVAKRKFTFTESGKFACDSDDSSNKDWIGGVITSSSIEAPSCFQLLYAATRIVGVYGVRVFNPEEAFLEYPDCVSAALSNILVAGVYFHHRRQGGYLVTREYQVAVESIGTVEPRTGDTFKELVPHWKSYIQTVSHDYETQGSEIVTDVEGVIFRIIYIDSKRGLAALQSKKKIRSRPVEAKGLSLKWW